MLDNDTTHSRRYDFPVYYSSGATGLADHGVIIVSAEPVEYIERPTLLMKVKNSYGMRVGDTTMEPAYRLGDVIFLHPFMHAAADSYVLLRSESNESHGQKRAMIGLLLGESLTHWNLRKYNPPADFSVLKTDWPIADHIAGKYNR